MRIGSLALPNNVYMAPMAGITDRPFRQLCRRFGAGLAVCEMVSADTTLWGTPKSLRRLAYGDEPGPVSVQIVGADPVKMGEAARLNADLGADIIDINMGCPAKKVCNAAAGSALLRDESLVGRILEAVAEAVEVPVTLKIRTGWDRSHRNAPRIAAIAEQAGICALTIHGRTRADRFAGEAEYDTIRAVKQQASIPIIANGDIDGTGKAGEVLEYTGADAIMIGRAARGRPWLFEDICNGLQTGRHTGPRSPIFIRDLLLEHLDALYAHYGSTHGVLVARKHIGWYSRNLPAAADFRQRVFRVATTAEQLQLVRGFFDGRVTESNEDLAA